MNSPWQKYSHVSGKNRAVLMAKGQPCQRETEQPFIGKNTAISVINTVGVNDKNTATAVEK